MLVGEKPLGRAFVFRHSFFACSEWKRNFREESLTDERSEIEIAVAAELVDEVEGREEVGVCDEEICGDDQNIETLAVLGLLPDGIKGGFGDRKLLPEGYRARIPILRF